MYYCLFDKKRSLNVINMKMITEIILKNKIKNPAAMTLDAQA